MHSFLIILQNELLVSFRNMGKIISSFLFFIILISAFSILGQNNVQEDFQRFYLTTLIWLSLISCITFSTSEFLKKDFQDGTIEQMLTSIDNFEIFILAKMLANWLIYSLPAIFAIFIINLTSEFKQPNLASFLVIILLATIIINFICTFCGSLSILENSASMISVIALPLIIPILLIAYSGLDEANTASSIKLLCGLGVLIASVSTFATAKIVKIAAE